MEEYIFVYGVFRDSGKGLLEGCKFCGKATVDGDIYRVNDFYPGFTRSKGKVIGDVYLINKEDRGGAEEVAREVERSLALSAKDPNWKPPVLIGSMENESGASAVLEAIESHLNYRRSKN